MKFSAAVIGLGNMGQGFDYDIQDDSRVLTHASGFHYHPRFQLLAGTDPDPVARERFTKKYQQPAFPTLRELYENVTPDVVAIAVPTPLHYSVFQEVLRYSPRGVILEKPMAKTLAEAKKMVQLAGEAHCALLVNYLRRFEPGVLALKQRITAGECGDIYKGVLWYSKGIANNGSHFIDLLLFLLGAAGEAVILNKGRDLPDPEPDVQIRFGEVDCYLLAGREECFSVKELELMATRASIKYLLGGAKILIHKTRPHPMFANYTVLEESGVELRTDLEHYQLHVLEALYQHLTSGYPLNSTGVTALSTMAVLDQIARRIRGD